MNRRIGGLSSLPSRYIRTNRENGDPHFKNPHGRPAEHRPPSIGCRSSVVGFPLRNFPRLLACCISNGEGQRLYVCQSFGKDVTVLAGGSYYATILETAATIPTGKMGPSSNAPVRIGVDVGGKDNGQQ